MAPANKKPNYKKSTTKFHRNVKGSIESVENNVKIIPIPLPCSFCRNLGADFQCIVCGTFYCGVRCQIQDWQFHKQNTCLPRLVKATPVFGFPECRNARNVSTTELPSNRTSESDRPGSLRETSQPTISCETPTHLYNFSKTPPKINVPFQSSHSNVPMPANMTKAGTRSSPPQANTSIPHVADLSVDVNINGRNESQQYRSSEPATDASKRQLKENILVRKRNEVQSSPSAKDALSTGIKESILTVSLPNETNTTVQTPATTKQRLLLPGPFPVAGLRRVKISHIDDSNIFIYCTGSEPNGQPNQYLQYMKRSLSSARKVQRYLQVPPKLFDIVYAPFEGEYYRAVVKSMEDSAALVMFPDIGNTLKVEWKLLKEILNPDIKYARSLTFEVCIDKVTNFTKPMYEFLSSLVETTEFELVKVENMPKSHLKVVDLRHLQELYLLSDKLCDLPNVMQQKTPLKSNQTKQTEPTIDSKEVSSDSSQPLNAENMPISHVKATDSHHLPELFVLSDDLCNLLHIKKQKIPANSNHAEQKEPQTNPQEVSSDYSTLVLEEKVTRTNTFGIHRNE